MTRIHVALLLLLLLASGGVSQTTRRVPQTYATIQAAINAAVNGDTVLVDTGTYVENIIYRGKKITVASHYILSGDTSKISATIIDGRSPAHADSGSVVRFDPGTDSSSTLIGFTIRGGKGSRFVDPTNSWVWYTGAGIWVYGSGARIVHNTIVDNAVLGFLNASAGAVNVYAPWSNDENAGFIILEDNFIARNIIDGYYAEGGALGFGMSGRVTRNTIVDNAASGTISYGGAFTIWGSSRLQFVNNIIARNDGGAESGAMWIYDYQGRLPDVTFVNNTIVFNKSKNNGAGVDFSEASRIILMNNIIWNPGHWVDVKGATDYASNNLIRNGYFGQNNWSENPRFADTITYALAPGSPCLGIGAQSLVLGGRTITAPSVDIDGKTRPNPSGGGPDLGAREVAASGTAPRAQQPRYDRHVLRHGGVDRSYWVYTPLAYDGVRKLPVVFFMHGSGGTMVQLHAFGFPVIADSLGVVLVAPKSLDAGWDNPIDLDFMSTLIDTINRSYAVDSNRVFLTGYSSGGIMSFRMAVMSKRRIAGIAPVVGAIPYDIGSSKPIRPIPLLYFAATNDQSVLWNGSTTRMGAPASVSAWLGFNGCTAAADTVVEPDIDQSDNVVVAKISYKCGTPMRWYILSGAAHGWPGPYMSASSMARDINATLEILKWVLKPTSAVEDRHLLTEAPRDFGLEQNYPNPFNPETNFEFRIANCGLVKLAIYDLLGREVEVLVDDEKQPGTYRATWDATNLPSGVYFYQLRAEGFMETRKCLLLR